MKTTSLIVALLTAGTLTVFGQEGTVQDIKHDAKKAGERIKEGVETVGENQARGGNCRRKNEGHGRNCWPKNQGNPRIRR